MLEGTAGVGPDHASDGPHSIARPPVQPSEAATNASNGRQRSRPTSVAKGILHLHEKLVRRESERTFQRQRIARTKIVVVDDEEIAEWAERPAEPSVRAEGV